MVNGSMQNVKIIFNKRLSTCFFSRQSNKHLVPIDIGWLADWMAGWDQNFRFHFPIYFFCFRFLFVLFIPPHYFLSTNLTYPRSMLVKSVCVCVCKDVEWQVFSICINLILTHNKNKQIHPYTEKNKVQTWCMCVRERKKT